MIESRYLHVVYCDDIREEVRNKISLIGCYSADLVVPKFPVALPKLCMHISAVTPISRPFERLKIRVFVNDELSGEIDMPPASFEGQSSQVIPHEATRMAVAAVVILSPAAVSEAGMIRVEAETEAETLIGNRLFLRETQSPAASAR